MKTRTSADWCRVLVECGVKPLVAAAWGSVFADTVKVNSFSAGDADLQDFLGQILHESAGLRVLKENLNYSPERLMAVWPHRFPTMEAAVPFAHNAEALANKVYGGRMGNRHPGDGWKYVGRSPIGVTGYDNYLFLENLMGQDFTVMPELLEQPHFALEACIHWWEDRIPDNVLGDPERETLRVNGGLIGLADRIQLIEAAEKALS